MHSLVLALAISLPTAEETDTLVVCPEAFRSALAPWVEHRQRQGHGLRLVGPSGTAEELRSLVRAQADNSVLRYVVLVGDAPPARNVDDLQYPHAIPTAYAQAEVNVDWGSEPEIATDNWFADLDDDRRPDLAVGRLTVDSQQELARVVQKILAYEKSFDYGTWRRQINLVAGVGGFGTLTDAVLEMATKRFLTEGVPAAYHTTMTYGSWQSPYCPDPRTFHDVTMRRLNEGCLFWIYIGHGQRRYLDHVRVPGGAFHILDVDDVRHVRVARGLPVAMMLACYTGAFDGPTDCLAEEMLRAEDGPVAAICGSRVTMPYGMTVLADALMDTYFRDQCRTLGQLLLESKRQMVCEEPANARRQLLDAVAAAFGSKPEQLAKERQEHLSLFNLIGDPLMRLRHPAEIQLQGDDTLTAGETIRVTGQCEVGGRGVVELVCRRDRTRVSTPKRNRFLPTNAFLTSLSESYREANDPVWTAQSFSSSGAGFDVDIEVPIEARGPCHLRAYIRGENDFAAGAMDVFIRRPKQLDQR